MQEYARERLNTLNTLQYTQISKNTLNTLNMLQYAPIRTSNQDNASICKKTLEYAPIRTSIQEKARICTQLQTVGVVGVEVGLNLKYN